MKDNMVLQELICLFVAFVGVCIGNILSITPLQTTWI